MYNYVYDRFLVRLINTARKRGLWVIVSQQVVYCTQNKLCHQPSCTIALIEHKQQAASRHHRASAIH